MSGLRSYAPASGALLGETPFTPESEIRPIVERARKAHGVWAAVPVTERASRIRRLGHALSDNADTLANALARECGKPWQEALLHEVVTLLEVIAWGVENAPGALATEVLHPRRMKHRRGEVHLVARGVVGVISPQPLPLLVPMASVVEALLAGNACVVKPSDGATLVMQHAKRIYDSTGLPEDLFALVLGGETAGRALVDAGIDYCLFTGTVEVGRRVATACGARLIPCVLELSGKAPLIACEDCDVERTARAIVFGAFASSGQTCVSVERVYAHNRVYETLLERVRVLCSNLRQGDPHVCDVDVGAMASSRPLSAATQHVEDALAKGARLVCGGRTMGPPGLFFEPTVLADCDHTMSVMRQESLGPVVGFMCVTSDEMAIELANDSELGLNAYVFSRDRARARRISERLEVGSVVVNDVLTNYAMPEAPFGGVKHSGYGRVRGADALRDMCQRKHVNFERVPSPKRNPYWFPYTTRGRQLLKRCFGLIYGRGNLARRVRTIM